MPLSPRFERDLADLGRSLKFSNPIELMAHWRHFVTRLLRADEAFSGPRLADALLTSIYDVYEAELASAARRLAEAEADPRSTPDYVDQARRRLAEQRAYLATVDGVLPQLRALLTTAADELEAEGQAE